METLLILYFLFIWFSIDVVLFTLLVVFGYGATGKTALVSAAAAAPVTYLVVIFIRRGVLVSEATPWTLLSAIVACSFVLLVKRYVIKRTAKR